MALIPVVIALFAGGYIKSFKGLGIELEARLKSPAVTLDLKATDALESVEGTEKDTLENLFRLPKHILKKFNRLNFVQGRAGYYNGYAVEEYLNNMPNLQYIEIKDETDSFICLLPVTILTGDTNLTKCLPDDAKIQDFIAHLENETVQSGYAECAFPTFSQNDDLLRVYAALQENNADYGVLLTPERQLKGVVRKEDVQQRFADEVMKTTDI